MIVFKKQMLVLMRIKSLLEFGICDFVKEVFENYKIEFGLSPLLF